MPVPNTLAGPSGAAGQGSHAPDGTSVEPASSKGPARALAKVLGALAAAASFAKRWLPEESDEPEPPLPSVDPGLPDPVTTPQTEKNKPAQKQDPRIRSDLADKWIKDNGRLNWPEANGGADGPEVPSTLQPGKIVDRYGEPSGAYLSPQGTPFPARSLPYDVQHTPLRTYRVVKPFVVDSGRASPWFDEPEGGLQYRTRVRVQQLISDDYPLRSKMMTAEDAGRLLQRNSINPLLYSIGGPSSTQCEVLEEINGVWSTYYWERGLPHFKKTYSSEAAAVAEFIKSVVDSASLSERRNIVLK